MNTSKSAMTLRALAVALMAAVLATASGDSGVVTAMTRKPAAASTAASTATDAYVYGYSLITTEVTRVQMSNVPRGRSSCAGR